MPREATPRITVSRNKEPVRGMTGAGRRKHALHSGMGVGCTADDLHLRLAGVDETDLKPVGIGMGLRRHD